MNPTGRALKESLSSGLAVVLLTFTLVGYPVAESSGQTLPACADFNDFDDNTLGDWTVSSQGPGVTVGSVNVSNGEVHLTGPATVFTAAGINKPLSLSGNFVVTVDLTQLGADGAPWRHGIGLNASLGNAILFHDADSAKIWRILKVVNNVPTDLLFADVAGSAGLENVSTTLKIKRVGNTYTFGIVRSGIETNLGSFDIADFPSFASVTVQAWAHNTPVSAKVDNFKFWTDTNAPTCMPVEVIATKVFLHGSGGTANPPTLVLDGVAPTGQTAKFKDSSAVSFRGGNLWKEIGTWGAAPDLTDGVLSGLAPLQVWLGLKNSDDHGTQFDLRADVEKNGTTMVASGTTRCITGVTRDPAKAKEATVSFGPFPPVDFNGTTDVLSLRLFTRIGTNPDESKCAGPGGSHSNAVGLRLYFDSAGRPAGFEAVSP